MCKIFLQTPLFWPLWFSWCKFWKLGQKLHNNYIAEVSAGPCLLHAKKNIAKPLIHPVTIINSTWYPRNAIVTTQNYPSNIKKLHLSPNQSPFFQITTTSKGNFFRRLQLLYINTVLMLTTYTEQTMSRKCYYLKKKKIL